MAGPVPTYLDTQLAAQSAFSVPFGLLSYVNGAINGAVADGRFNTTADCSLFSAVDVSNLRIYLTSLGYSIDFNRNGGDKSLNIDWGLLSTLSVVQGTVDVANFPAVQAVSIVGSVSGLNLFATTDSVIYGIETIILSHTVSGSFAISQVVAWGTYDGEFLIRVNGSIVGGGRTSAADRTLNVVYGVAPIPTTTGDVVTVSVQEYGTGLQQFRVNLLGE